MREALLHRIDHPLSEIVNASKTTAGPVASEKLLWTLLKLCVDRGGVLSSDASDASEVERSLSEALTPEMKIAQLLMGHAPAPTTATPSGTAAGGNTGAPSTAVKVFSGSTSSSSYSPDMTLSKELYGAFKPTDGKGGDVSTDQYVEIEALLVVGRKEEALRKAIQYGEWSLALLLGSVCGADKYQEVIRSYSASHFPASAPMHLLTLLFANSGSSAVMSTNKSGDALVMWRHNLSAILSNKASNWQQLATFLGYRLLSESKVSLRNICILVLFFVRWLFYLFICVYLFIYLFTY